MGHAWRRIEDLPADWREMATGELQAIATTLADAHAANPANAAECLRRAIREAAIETGQVEDLYRFPRGVTETLIVEGIRHDLLPRNAGNRLTDAQVAGLLEDQNEVLEGVFANVKGERPLSISYLRELHALLVRRQETFVASTAEGPQDHALRGGEFKKYPNSVKLPDGSIHEYCPVEQVESELDRLIAMNAAHERDSVPHDIRAAWLHHRFAQIHPFPDGNGRTARVLASMVLAKGGLFPFALRSDSSDVGPYLRSLVSADLGDLSLFLELNRRIQRRQLVRLVDFTGGVIVDSDFDRRVREMHAIARRSFERLREQLLPVYDPKFGVLYPVGEERISPVPGYGFPHEYVDGVPSFDNCLTIFLRVRTIRNEYFVCSFHQIGHGATGLVGCVIYLGNASNLKAKPDSSGSHFLATSAEEPASVVDRFQRWLTQRLGATRELWSREILLH